MKVQLVVLDGDGVLWDHQDLSALTLPFRLSDRDTIVDANGERVRLLKGVRKLLRILAERGVIVTLATWNKLEHVAQALQLFKVDEYFRVVEARFHPDKHLMIKSILEKLMSEGVTVEPNQILYVDDRTVHIADVRKEIGDVRFLQMHVDAKDPLEILRYIGNEGEQC